MWFKPHYGLIEHKRTGQTNCKLPKSAYLCCMNIASYIDHTLLKSTARETDMITLCNEAKQYGFYAVCVNGCWIETCNHLLEDSGVKLAAVAGFPLGAGGKSSKIYEVKNAVINGADEVDMVMNIGFAKDGKWDYILNEIKVCKADIGVKILKVIIETCYLTEDEIKRATEIVLQSGADFIKTSTGFGTGGATLSDIAIMKSVIGDAPLKIKASGGIKDYETAMRFIEAGVQRIGTSNGIAIVQHKPTLGNGY